MNKTCNFCGNRNFKKRRVQYIYRHDRKYLFVNNVPCEQCEYCGERYFTADTLKKIEEDFKAVHLLNKKAKKELTVPVEEFVEI